MTTEGLSLYKNYAIRKELIERGIRKDLKDWISELQSDRAEDYRKYLLAGLKTVDLVKKALELGISVEKVLEIKHRFMSFGMSEEEAELWTKAGLLNPSLAIILYKKGYDWDFAQEIVESKVEKKEDMQYWIKYIGKYTGLSEKEILWEFSFYRKFFRGSSFDLATSFWLRAKSLGVL